MKTALSLGLALTMGTFALMGTPNDAHAINANNAGTACKNYNAGEVTSIDYLVDGTRNISSTSKYVICPIVRSPASTTAPINVYVDGYASPGKTISCTVFSYDYTGTYLGSKSFPSARTGTFDVFLSVPGKYWATASVLCLLPPSGTGLIYDVDVVQ